MISEKLCSRLAIQGLYNESEMCHDRALECQRLSKTLGSWLTGQRHSWQQEAEFWFAQRDRWRTFAYELETAMKPQEAAGEQ